MIICVIESFPHQLARLLQVLEDEQSTVTLLCEATMTLGSLAYGQFC